MTSEAALLAIDQGTTSSRAMVFRTDGSVVAMAQEQLPQHYPREGWVEHDPEDIWQSVLSTAQAALREAESKGVVVQAIGITNQRETTLLWDRKTGTPVHRAIVWQDRRTADACRELREAGHLDLVSQTTGLVIDPYFSASKLTWLLDHVGGARDAAEAGNLAFGTVDSYLLFRLTGGRVHATDATNACRTSLYDIGAGRWSEALCDLYRVPTRILPEVRDSAADFGTTDPDLFGRSLQIAGLAGDQQAATVGQACFQVGDLKSTYGTGCFAVLNTGAEIVRSKNQLLSTIAYQLDGRPTYAIEGSIFIAGAAVQWLRDELGLLADAAETAERAARAAADAQVIMVPAFAGMGAPHWAPDARAAVFGMTRATGPDELARAALEGVVYQTCDLFAAMRADGLAPRQLKVDGGMVANDWFVQRLADLCDLTVDRPHVRETTALGAAYLAGLQIGLYASLDDIAGHWQSERRFTPQMKAQARADRLRRWHACVDAVKAIAASGGNDAGGA
jgi:glycerol kinase